MKLTIVVTITIIFSLITAERCESMEGIGRLPLIKAHSTFYPHPHMKDLKAAAKRGKILVITLVVSAGLVVLISTAIIRGGKDEEETDTVANISPAELRASVIAAANSCKISLAAGTKQAIDAAFSTYASFRGMELDVDVGEYSSPVTYNIGKDRVTVNIFGDGAVEVRSICGNLGATALADAKKDSVQSSIFMVGTEGRRSNV
jgi:hypothetical protein